MKDESRIAQLRRPTLDRPSFILHPSSFILATTMTLFSLLWRNLLYFWRGDLAVMLGVLVGGTVLTGALFVGDSPAGQPP